MRWRNLLGQRIVYLYPGVDEGALADGDEIGRTRDVVDIGALIDELGAWSAPSTPPSSTSSSPRWAAPSTATRPASGELLDGAGSLLTVLADRDTTIQGLLDDFNTVSAALVDRDSQVRTMVGNLTLLTEAFAENEDLVDSTLAELGAYSTDLRTVLTGNESELGSIVGQPRRRGRPAHGPHRLRGVGAGQPARGPPGSPPGDQPGRVHHRLRSCASRPDRRRAPRRPR